MGTTCDITGGAAVGDIAYGPEAKKKQTRDMRRKMLLSPLRFGGHRKSRDFDPIVRVSLANRSAMMVIAPLAFWT